MAHGLSGTRRDRLGAFAERFAAAGIAALVFDHRGFGDSGEPDLFIPKRQMEHWHAAIGFARSLPAQPWTAGPGRTRWSQLAAKAA
jgi:alpha-beta hydrolase superfamily lysophospholipase